MKMSTLDYIALVLVIIGGLNWGLVGAFEYNLVDELFGVGSGLSRAIYVIVGIEALYLSIMLASKSGKAKA